MIDWLLSTTNVVISGTGVGVKVGAGRGVEVALAPPHAESTNSVSRNVSKDVIVRIGERIVVASLGGQAKVESLHYPVILTPKAGHRNHALRITA